MAAQKKVSVTEVQSGLIALMNAGYECQCCTRNVGNRVESWRHAGGHEFLLVIDQAADSISVFSLQLAPLTMLLKSEEKPAETGSFSD